MCDEDYHLEDDGTVDKILADFRRELNLDKALTRDESEVLNPRRIFRVCDGEPRYLDSSFANDLLSRAPDERKREIEDELFERGYDSRFEIPYLLGISKGTAEGMAIGIRNGQNAIIGNKE